MVEVEVDGEGEGGAARVMMLAARGGALPGRGLAMVYELKRRGLLAGLAVCLTSGVISRLPADDPVGSTFLRPAPVVPLGLPAPFWDGLWPEARRVIAGVARHLEPVPGRWVVDIDAVHRHDARGFRREVSLSLEPPGPQPAGYPARNAVAAGCLIDAFFASPFSPADSLVVYQHVISHGLVHGALVRWLADDSDPDMGDGLGLLWVPRPARASASKRPGPAPGGAGPVAGILHPAI